MLSCQGSGSPAASAALVPQNARSAAMPMDLAMCFIAVTFVEFLPSARPSCRTSADVVQRAFQPRFQLRAFLVAQERADLDGSSMRRQHQPLALVRGATGLVRDAHPICFEPDGPGPALHHRVARPDRDALLPLELAPREPQTIRDDGSFD